MYLDDTLFHVYMLLSVGDLYVHADLHGASSVIIKNPAGRCRRRSSGISVLVVTLHVKILTGKFHISLQFYVPRTKYNISKRAFSVAAPSVCNELPTTIT